jgi:hypothetical protein
MSANHRNEAVQLALAAARAVSPAPAPRIEQPQLATVDLDCLMTGYLHDEVYLDLYGYADEDDGCMVEGVALAGTKIDLTCMTKPEELRRMERFVDSRAVAAKQSARQEARAESAYYDRA